MDVIDQTGRVFRLARRVAVIGVGAVVFGVVRTRRMARREVERVRWFLSVASSAPAG